MKFVLFWNDPEKNAVCIDVNKWGQLVETLRQIPNVGKGLDVYWKGKQIAVIFLNLSLFLMLESFPAEQFNLSVFFDHGDYWPNSPLSGESGERTDPYLVIL